MNDNAQMSETFSEGGGKRTGPETRHTMALTLRIIRAKRTTYNHTVLESCLRACQRLQMHQNRHKRGDRGHLNEEPKTGKESRGSLTYKRKVVGAS